MMLTYFLLAAALGYLLGSIPVGYLVGRANGIDIREHGSGNIGATNVVRVLGKKPGYFVFLCDALKGWLAVWLARFTVSMILSSQDHSVDHVYSYSTVSLAAVGIVAALACILGHNFPVWLKFRGGKGVATTVGTLLGLMPLAFLVVAVVWIITFYTLRYVSVASIVAATILPISVWVFGKLHLSGNETIPMLYFSIVAAALVWWRHRSNIQRLRAGTEPKFARKPKTAPESKSSTPAV